MRKVIGSILYGFAVGCEAGLCPAVEVFFTEWAKAERGAKPPMNKAFYGEA